MSKQKVFLSWSQADSPSHLLAQLLYEYLPLLHDDWEPFLSSESIKAGTGWSSELFRELEGSHFGVLCISIETAKSEWMLFEAGALVKAFSTARVVPLLINMGSGDLPAPLKAFQAIYADEDGIERLIDTLADVAGMNDNTTKIVKSRLSVYWKDIKERIKKSERAAKDRPKGRQAVSQKLSVDDQLKEVIDYCRNFEKRLDLLNRRFESAPSPGSGVIQPITVTVTPAPNTAPDSPPVVADQVGI